MSNITSTNFAFNNSHILKSRLDPTWTKFPASYITSRITKAEVAIDFINRDIIDSYRGHSIKEELLDFYNNGGTGIDLSFTEACIFHAILNIFTRDSYPEYVRLNESKLFKAMGYDKSPSGWERNNLNKKLKRLSNKKFPFYWTEIDQNKHRFKWLTFDNLFTLEIGSDSEDNFGTSSQECLPRVRLNKNLVRNLHNTFRLAIPHIGKEIKEYRKSRGERASKYDIRLYDLLLNENKKVISWNYLKIAQGPLLMGKLIKERKIKLVREKVTSIYKMYKDLGILTFYLLDQKGTKNTKDILFLNPDRFYRLRNEKINEK